MNKREEFEKVLQALIEYTEQATRSYPLELARKREYSGYADEEKAKLLALFDAAQPSQDGLPKLPAAYMQINRPPEGGDHVLVYTADQMHAYGAQCRAVAIPEGFVLVPREPTLEMIAAPGMATAMRSGSAAQIYRAMLAAATKGDGKDLSNGG